MGCVCFSLIASSAFGGASWVETDKTEVDILTEYKHRILHLSTSVFGPYGNSLLTTIVTSEGSFRCAASLPNSADKVALSLREGQSVCSMAKLPEVKKSKKKKRKKRKKRKED